MSQRVAADAGPGNAFDSGGLWRACVSRGEVNAALERFERDGWAPLGPVLSPLGIATLQRRVDAVMDGRIGTERLFFQHDAPSGRYSDLSYGEGWVGPSRHYRKIERLERDPLFLAFLRNPLFVALARAWLGERVLLYRSVLWNKAGQGGTNLPWHQDDGLFWGIDRAPSLQIWTALDCADERAGCVEVVPGTHRAGLATHQGGTIPDEVVSARPEAAAPVPLVVAAGEAVLIHNHVWHRSGHNLGDQPRRAISVSLLHGDTGCRRRRRAPRQFPVLLPK